MVCQQALTYCKDFVDTSQRAWDIGERLEYMHETLADMLSRGNATESEREKVISYILEYTALRNKKDAMDAKVTAGKKGAYIRCANEATKCRQEKEKLGHRLGPMAWSAVKHSTQKKKTRKSPKAAVRKTQKLGGRGKLPDGPPQHVRAMTPDARRMWRTSDEGKAWDKKNNALWKEVIERRKSNSS